MILESLFSDFPSSLCLGLVPQEHLLSFQEMFPMFSQNRRFGFREKTQICFCVFSFSQFPSVFLWTEKQQKVKIYFLPKEKDAEDSDVWTETQTEPEFVFCDIFILLTFSLSVSWFRLGLTNRTRIIIFHIINLLLW